MARFPSLSVCRTRGVGGGGHHAAHLSPKYSAALSAGTRPLIYVCAATGRFGDVCFDTHPAAPGAGIRSRWRRSKDASHSFTFTGSSVPMDTAAPLRVRGSQGVSGHSAGIPLVCIFKRLIFVLPCSVFFFFTPF